MANTDEVIAALKKAAAKVAGKQAKDSVNKVNQKTQDTEIQSRNLTPVETQTQKDLNTIKPVYNTSGFSQGSAFAKLVNSKQGTTSSSNKPSAYQLQEIIDKKQRQTGWEKFTNTVKNIGTSIYELGKGLVSEYITNQDKSKGILDYDKYQQYQAQMVSDSTTQEQRNQLMNKMVSEGVIDQTKYNARVNKWTEKQEKDPDALINQVKENQREEYRNELKAVLEPYVKEATTHYQIDAYSKAVDKLMKQFDYSFDNVVNTYDDTRDRNIIEYWNTDGTTLKNGIKDFLGFWGDYISQGYTDKEAYKAVIKDHADLADKIVNAENRIKNMTYKAVVSNNFSKEGNVSGTTFTQITNGILGVVNNISFMVDKVMSQPIEELKQRTSYYDIVEELANLNIRDETDGWLKSGYKTVASWMRSVYDAAPTVLPTIAGIVLTKKLAIPEKLTGAGQIGEEVIAGRKVLSKKGATFLGNLAGNYIEDLAILDGVAQVSMQGPMTREDAVWNTTFNIVVDSFVAKSAMQPAKQYLSEIPRGDMMSRVVKKELVDELSTMKDYGKMADYYVNYLTLDIINGTENVGKTVNLDDLRPVSPELVERVETVQKLATQFTKGLEEGDVSAQRLAELYNLQLKAQQAKALEALNKLKETAAQRTEELAQQSRRDRIAQSIKNQRTLSTNPEYRRTVINDYTNGVVNNKIGGTVSDVAKNIIDDAKFITDITRLQGDSVVKFTHSTVKSLNSRGIISDGAIDAIVRNATQGENIGIYDLVSGLLKGDAEGVAQSEKGYKQIQEAKQTYGAVEVASQIKDVYNNVFAEVLKTYGDVLEAGDMVGTYVKQADGTFKDIFTGTVGTVDEIVSKYTADANIQKGNTTISNLIKASEGIINDVVVAEKGDGEIIKQSKSGNTRYKSGSTVWSTGGKNGSEKSILMNNYFVKSTKQTGTDGLPIDRLGSITAEQFYKDKGYKALARKIFDDVGFDFAVTKDTVQGKDVYHMYIWSRNIDNAENFTTNLNNLQNKSSMKQMTSDEFFTFKVSHAGEYLDTFKSYCDVNGITTQVDREAYANKFKTWFEGLYERQGDEYIMKNIGTPDQTDRLAKTINSNTSLDVIESASASNEISSKAKEASDELGFMPSKNQIDKSNKIMRQKSLGGEDVLDKYEQVRNVLKKTFVNHYNDPKLYDQVVDYLTDFIVTFTKEDVGIKPGVVQAIGDLYADIITSPETLKAISKFDRGFFAVLTAKLIYNGVESNAREFNQAFAEFMKEYSDKLFNRIGTDNLSEYINLSVYNLADTNLIVGLKEFADNIEALTMDKKFKREPGAHSWGDKTSALYKSFDGKAIKDYILQLGVIDTKERDMFFKEGLSIDALTTGRTWLNNKKAVSVKNLSKSEINNLIDYVTWKELKAAGIYDYSLLQQMRKGLADMISNGATLDNNMKLSIVGNRLVTQYIPTEGAGSVLKLGPIDVSRLWIRGSRISDLYKEGLIHELSHIESIAKYNEGLDEYLELINDRIAKLNPSDRKDLAAHFYYLLTGEKDIQGVMNKLNNKSALSSLEGIADFIWTNYNKDLKSVNRFNITKSFFLSVISPLEEILTEAYTINSLFGGTGELPKGFAEAISKASGVYKTYMDAIDLLESESFETLDDFKKALYNNSADISSIRGGDAREPQKLINELSDVNDELGFIPDDVALKNIVNDIDNPKWNLTEDQKSILKQINDNGTLNKYLYDDEHGLLNQQIPEQDIKNNIIKYSLIGKNSAPDKGNFLDQITKSYINPRNDWMMNTQGNMLKYFENNGLKKNEDVSILGIVNNQTLPLVDSQMGQKVAGVLNDIIKAKQGGAYVKINAGDLLVGEDVLQGYRNYMELSLQGFNLKDYIDNIEVNGKWYSSFDEYIKANNVEFKPDIDNKIKDLIYSEAEYAIPGEKSEFLGVISQDIMSKFDNKTYKKLIEDWNNAVYNKLMEEDYVLSEDTIMPLQTYIISRHTLNILNAIGEYQGTKGNKFIDYINNFLKENANTKVFSKLAQNDLGPVNYILNVLAKDGAIEQYNVGDILALLGSDNTKYVDDLLKRVDGTYRRNKNHTTDFMKERMNKLRTKLGIQNNALKSINQSLGNLFKNQVKAIANIADIADQERACLGRLYEILVETSYNINNMMEKGGKKLNKVTFSKDLSEAGLGARLYDDVLITLNNAAEGRWKAYSNKFLINNDESLMFRESRPYNLHSNLGIQLSQYLDTTTQAQYRSNKSKISELLYKFSKSADSKNKKTVNAVVKNSSKTLDNIPVSDHIDYLQTYGIKNTKENGAFNKVVIDMYDVKKNTHSMYNLYSGKGRINGIDRSFSAIEELNSLVYWYNQKQDVDIVLQYKQSDFQVIDPKAKISWNNGEPLVKTDGLVVSYNNIFSSFIGRDICEKLGIEKDFLNSSQTNVGTLKLIYGRLQDLYQLTNDPIRKESIGKTMMWINYTFNKGLRSNIYDNSLTKVFNAKDFVVKDMFGNKTDIKIESYIPTMSVGKATMNTEGEEIGDLIGGELISSDKWISNQIDYDRFKDEIGEKYMGENINTQQQAAGAFLAKGTDEDNNTIYGVLSISDTDIKDATFIPYSINADYEKLLTEGTITPAEYDKIILAGYEIKKINDASGIETKFVVNNTTNIKQKRIDNLVKQLNDTLEKIHKDEIDLINAKANREELRQLDIRLNSDKEELDKISDELGMFRDTSLRRTTEVDTNKVFDELLDEEQYSEVVDMSKKENQYLQEKINKLNYENAVRIGIGDNGEIQLMIKDTPIEKNIDLKKYQDMTSKEYDTVIGIDGRRYDPATTEGMEALKNGGVDERMLEEIDMEHDYITNAQENKIASNLFSFGNYDVIQANPVLKGIAGHRTNFLDNNKEALKKAIDEFNTVTRNLSLDEKEQLFRNINSKAREVIKEHRNMLGVEGQIKQYVELPCNISGLIKVEGAEDIEAAVRKIGNIFVHLDTATELNPSWSWAHQFATLNYKGGFDDLWMRLNSNEFSASTDYLLQNGVSIIDGKDLRNYIRDLVKSTGASNAKADIFVHDWFGDSLGTSALYKLDANAKSLYRIMKYSPLSPISGTLMLIQSTLLGISMYFSKKVGLGKLMDSPLFNLLTTKKGEKVMIDGVEQEGLGWLYSLTRQGDINLNSNTDLGRTLVDRTLDRILGIVPMPKGMRDSVQSVMKGGVQSIWDIASQNSVKNMSLAQALVSNGITSEYQLKKFLQGIKNGTILQNRVAKILGDAEVNYSRFFSNSATTVMSRNRFSRLWMFNCMNNYTILRSDEVVQGVMKFWRDWRNGMLNDMTFGEYLFERNPELKGLMNNVLMSVKMGYHFNLMANGDNDNQENLEKYIVDSSDYLSSIPATFFYNILSAPFKGVGDYIEYTNAVGESETFGGAAKAAALTTLSKTMSQFFREGKIINVMRDWLVAYAKTGDLDYAGTVAGVDLEKIANGLGRFMLVEGTESYGNASLTEKGDAIGQILFNSFETNQYGKAKTKLNNIVTAEEYINGNLQDNVINILAYMPVLGEFIKNATTGQGFTFTQAKYEELEKMVDNSPVIQNLYKGILNNEDFTDAAINRLYSELIKYDYTANRTLGKNGEYKLGSYDNKTGKDTTLNDMKEAVFTKNMLDKLGMTREEFVAKLNKADQDGDEKALIKILAMAQAAEPGSSRVCLSYLANNYHYNLMKQYSGKEYPSGNDVTEEQANEINRKVVQRYYPDMFVVDKTSLYKAIREYISIANPTIFDTLYRDDDLSGYVNSLGYLDMLMFQFAHQDGDVDARYIKNAFSLIGKYVQNTDARISIMNHTMQTIEDLDTYDSVKTMMKMGVIAGNTDIYDKIKNDEIMNIMNPEILQRYENFVWGVNEEINQKGTELAQKELSDKEKKQYKGIYGKNFRYSNYANGNSKTQDDVEEFVPKVFPIEDTPYHKFTTIPYTPSSFTPYKHSPLYFYIKIYEDTIKETSDKLVTTIGKKYPAQTIEGMTYHGNTSNKGKIKAGKLEFPTKSRRARSYSTDRWAGYPGG